MSSKVIICAFYHVRNYHCQDIIDNSAFYLTHIRYCQNLNMFANI